VVGFDFNILFCWYKMTNGTWNSQLKLNEIKGKYAHYGYKFSLQATLDREYNTRVLHNTLIPLVLYIRKFSKKKIGLIYNKISQLSKCSYCIKDFSTLNLMFVFLILAGVFNASQFFMKVYL